MPDRAVAKASEMVRSAIVAIRRDPWQLWNFIYALAVATLFLMAIERRFGLPLVPILDLDSANYLWPALLKLNGEGFVHNAGLNFFYPSLLFLLLRVFSDFRSIVILQHALGVAGGVFFLLAWNRLRALDTTSVLPKAVHEAIGLFGVAVYLLSPIPIIFEQQIRPEALCMFVQMLSFWLVLPVIFYHRAPANETKTVIYGIASAASAVLLCSLKPSYTFTALLVVAFLVWLVLRARLSGRSRWFFFVGAAMSALVFLTPEYLLARGDRLSKMFLPQTLFCVHADIIRDQIGEDLARGAAVPFPQPWLETAFKDLDAEISRLHVRAPRQFSLLGFDPDHLMNGDDAIFNRWLEELGNDNELKRFVTYYYWRALCHRPVSFSLKIARQMGVFYTRECPAFLVYRRIPLLAWHYKQSIAVITDPENWAQLRKNGAGLRLLAQTEEVSKREIIFDLGKRLFSYHTFLARSYLPLLVVSVGVALWVLLAGNRAPAKLWPSFLVLFFFLTNFGNVIAISTVHTMEVQRYSAVQFAAALFAELWAIRYLADFIVGRFARKRG